MSEFETSAPAPSEAVVNADPAPFTQGLGSQTPVAPEKNGPTPRDALDKADAKFKAARAADKAKSNVDELARLEKLEGKREKLSPAEDRDRALKTASAKLKVDAEAKETAGKEFAEPPARFSLDAKSAWEAAPEPIRAETHRAIRELESGIERHRAGNQSWDQVRQYDDIARQNGGSLPQSLARVVEIEQAFARNPVEGLHKITSHFGLDLHQVASHIAQMRPEQFQQMQSQSQVAAMQQQMQMMQQQHSQVIETVQKAHVGREVAEFAKSHPRVDELAHEIAAELRAGYDLETAYARAEKLAGSSNTGARASHPGSKSISGAPSGGGPSATGQSKPSSSNREALQRAMSRVGRL